MNVCHEATVPMVPRMLGWRTWILPLATPAGTKAWSWVDETNVVEAKILLLKNIRLVLRKLEPLTVTRVPTAPEVGEKLLMVGRGKMVRPRLGGE